MGRGTALCVLGIGAGAAAVAMALAVAGDRPVRDAVASTPTSPSAPVLPAPDPRAVERARWIEALRSRDPERRLLAVDRLLAPELWDPGVVIPAFAAVLRDVGPAVPASDLDAQLVRRIVDGLRDRPSLPHVPLLFECMEDTEASWLNMQIHGLLFAWLAGGDVSSVALQARPARRSWRQLWDRHGDARLLPRGRDWPAGAADRR